MNQADLILFRECMTRANLGLPRSACQRADLDGDDDVDQDDFGILQRCYTELNLPVDAHCMD